MPKREFVYLAHTFKPEKHGVAGWWWSEKLDGQRCFWDGGVSRGKPKNSVPWANTNKDARYKDLQIATGLWSRYGNIIHAPDWFLDKLPKILLDGELWSSDRIFRQEISSIIKTLIPNSETWKKIHYCVFDSPSRKEIFADGRINVTNFKKTISFSECQKFYEDYKLDDEFDNLPFRRVFYQLATLQNFNRIEQYELAFNTTLALKQIEHHLDVISNLGGEGLIIRNPDASWKPWRSHNLLKIKKLDDAEGTVIGYISGKETDLGSKHLGYVGALIIDFNGKRMELSGLNDNERFLTGNGFDWATKHPGQEVPKHFEAMLIPKGTIVTFKYRGLSKDGIPQEARYWRKRND
jgi:DNA ligase 1